jgi:Phage Terminase
MSTPDLAALKRDPIAFIQHALRDPETGQPFVLSHAQKRFLRRALIVTPAGKLKYPELVFSCGKKGGKSTLAGMIVLYIIVALAGPYGEAIIVANDYEQALARTFAMIARIIESSPLLRNSAKIMSNRIVFSNGSTITAISSDYASAAGSNANIVTFDELWAYTSERSRRLWDELVPPPTRKVALRLTTTYAGYENESDLLLQLYKRGLSGIEVEPSLYESPSILMAWHHEPIAPWQDQEWLDQMRTSLRPNAYLRLVENRWTTTEERFVDINWWDECVSADAHYCWRTRQSAFGAALMRA